MATDHWLKAKRFEYTMECRYGDSVEPSLSDPIPLPLSNLYSLVSASLFRSSEAWEGFQSGVANPVPQSGCRLFFFLVPPRFSLCCFLMPGDHRQQPAGSLSDKAQCRMRLCLGGRSIRLGTADSLNYLTIDYFGFSSGHTKSGRMGNRHNSKKIKLPL